jgi:acylphosphatase
MSEDGGSVVRRRVVARGRVQGVFYRDSCRREAQRRRVAGWVANRADGSVEAVFEGPRREVAAMIDWARSGPPRARVDELEVSDEPPTGERGFRVV